MKNTFGDEIPVGGYDFIIVYDYEGETYYSSAEEDYINDEQYPVDVYIKHGEMVEGYVYFVVDRGAENFRLEYVEYYEDESIGETFTVPLEPYIKNTYEDFDHSETAEEAVSVEA